MAALGAKNDYELFTISLNLFIAMIYEELDVFAMIFHGKQWYKINMDIEKNSIFLMDKDAIRNCGLFYR